MLNIVFLNILLLLAVNTVYIDLVWDTWINVGLVVLLLSFIVALWKYVKRIVV